MAYRKNKTTLRWRALEEAARETPRKLPKAAETKEARRDRLDARRERQLSHRSGTAGLHLAGDRKQLIALRQRFWAGQIGYRPHQGQRECRRREKQIVLAWAAAP